MKQFEYKPDGGCALNGNPMISGFKVNLGKDDDGKEWLCKISPTGQMKHLMWAVEFDTADEYWTKHHPNSDFEGDDFSSPFLRPEVVYADNWHEMCEKRYHRKVVEYIDINKTVSEFVERQGIK